jgi:transcription-repair coupling factor (superfamily II helicase)
VLAPGDPLDLDALRAALAERGYYWDELVDEPGEVALRGRVIDVFPAGGDIPARLELDGGVIASIQAFDPLTQRSTAPLDRVVLHPAVEFPLDPEEIEEAAEALASPDEADPDRPALPAPPPRLAPLFDELPGAPCYIDPEVPERWTAAYEAIQDAFAAASKARRIAVEAGQAVLPRPARLYLTPAQASAVLGPAIEAPGPSGEAVAAPRRIEDLLGLIRAAPPGAAVLVATPSEHERVAASLRRRGVEANAATQWDGAPGVAVLPLDTASGWRTDGLLLVPIGNLVRPRAEAALLPAAEAPRIGEIVVHLDHGVARLEGLRAVEGEDRVALAFAAEAELLVPAEELDRIWRYGEEGAALDRISGEAWRQRRAEIEAETDRTAAALAEAAAVRAQASAPVFKPPTAGYALVARRFPYPPSPDQRAAIQAVLADLAAGRPMDRLLCGDVGFGKTEVALRAAASVALSGWQVALAAPTTVLARQHLDVVRARFAGTGVRVEALVRNAASRENRELRQAVARGEVGIVVGTHGLARLRYAKLGLAVIDEEQRFGEEDKARLAGMAPHVLTMSATPIPRTLQAALVGLRDVSVLATPPRNRQPTRTFVLPWDGVVIREALLRERRRGGQSFVVCPRIADLQAMTGRLRELVPELAVTVAHGRMSAEALEDAVLGFAGGEGDVLLATNIIEAGLDMPRANLMLVTEADRFGLAQLHQLRGRVGRGGRRGAAYFLTEPGRRLTAATRRRLQTMETLSGLGAGVAVSAADLGLRGAGDLFGAAQAGHVRAVGTELYRDLLARSIAARRGEKPKLPPPTLRTGAAGRIPEQYVPEANLRLALLRRLALLEDTDALDEFAQELQDRFGPLPPDTVRLLRLHRLRLLGRSNGLASVDAGPQAVALTPADPAAVETLARALGGSAKDGRVLLGVAVADSGARLERLVGLLEERSAG